MNENIEYIISQTQKSEIAQNLIEIQTKDATINKETRIFISNWILSGPGEKGQDYYDVWDTVLKNYLPTKRPILFSSCETISKKNEIKSFTGRLECVTRFSNGKDILIICETNETLRFEGDFFKIGNYKNTFYPLVSVLRKAKNAGGCGFSERILNTYIGEDEYIMRFNLENMHSLRWN